MDHPEGAGLQWADQVDFGPRVRLKFKGTQLSLDGGLLVMRELDDTLGPFDLAVTARRDTRRGKNAVHRLDGLIRPNRRPRTVAAAIRGIECLTRSPCQPINMFDDIPHGKCRPAPFFKQST